MTSLAEISQVGVIRLKRTRLALGIFCLLTLSLAIASCKRSSDSDGNNNAGNANTAEETLATPPYASKEPDRYQAIRVITSGGAENAGSGGSFKSETFIARDGERRREDYEAVAGMKVSFVQLPNATYLILPEKKIYAELTPAGSIGATGNSATVPPDFSPERLLNAARPETLYQSLGPENVNGRATRKYRVVLRTGSGSTKESTTESLVWVDDSLGMPIRSEMTSTGGAKVTMEMRDIKEAVDSGAFDLPQDFMKVEEKELFAQLDRPPLP